ncbi:MAG: hypothetical protein WD711_09010 [Dongiaceae bacterium]
MTFDFLRTCMRGAGRLAASLLAAFLVVGAAAMPASAEDDTVEAFSSWEASGHIYPTGPEESTFVGVLSGILYVRDKENTIDAGLIMCPGTVTIDTTDGSQHGTAKCVIVTPESDRVFGSFECEGIYNAGCAGEFTITGGTGNMAGITGGGPIRLQSAFANAALVPGSIIDQTAAGLALWPALSYQLP